MWESLPVIPQTARTHEQKKKKPSHYYDLSNISHITEFQVVTKTAAAVTTNGRQHFIHLNAYATVRPLPESYWRLSSTVSLQD